MEALISVDPHKASVTLAVFDTAKRVAVAEARFATTTEGYRSLKQFAKQWPKRWWAVEGSLAQRLVADDERVVDVPASSPLECGCSRRDMAARPTATTRCRLATRR